MGAFAMLLAAALLVQQEAADPAAAAAPAALAAARFADARRLLARGAAESIRAEALLEEALAFWRAAGNREGEAETLRALGQAAAYHNSPKALEYREAARALWHTLGNTAGETSALLEIGVTHYSHGSIDAALDAFSRGLDVARGGGHRDLEAALLSNIANAYTWRGDPQRALDAIDEAAAIWREIGNTSSEGSVQRHRGSIYMRLGDSATALQCFRDALRAARASGSRLDEGFTLSTMAAAYVEAGDDARALRTYEDALALWRSTNARRGQAGVLNEIGLIHARRQRLDLATSFYARALELARETGHRAAEASTLLNQGTLDMTRRRLDAAGAALGESLILWRAVGDRMGEASTLVSLARLDRLRGDARQAREHLDAALAIVESIRGNVRAPDLRGSYLASVRRAYEELIDVLVALHAADPRGGHDAASLLASERAHARSLLDLLAGANVSEAAGAEPLDLAAIRDRVLDEGTVLVEYTLGAARSHAWVVTRTSMTVVELPARARIDAAARRLHRLVSAGHKREIETPLRRAVDEVSGLILAPLAAHLSGRRLLVVPDAALQYVPFAALTVPAAGGAVPLLDRYELAVLPSASAAAALRSADGLEAPSRSVVVVAGRRNAGGLAPLPFARREADAIAALAQRDYSVVVQSGLDREAPARARIVHFAAHALVDVARPERSGIALDDGLLTLRDVYGLRLDADLVVLSGCRTALGRQVAGEGLIGLTRGFLYAGARSVVASLWDVSDAATATLMTRFYRRLLLDGDAPAAALRWAQRSMARDPRWRAPYYWAGFELQGPAR